ncbi:MAG: GDCCVxC domain-containing (seleno)protein [Gemmatimonadaceae bacterium]
METSSELRCPVCGERETLLMPTDACQFFHECSRCHTVLRPLEGDCCVFCSYGSVPCPPIQEARASGAASSCCSPAGAVAIAPETQ